jgi:hypothetical protein
MALITFQMHMPARAGPAGEGASLRAATDSVNRKGWPGLLFYSNSAEIYGRFEHIAIVTV